MSLGVTLLMKTKAHAPICKQGNRHQGTVVFASIYLEHPRLSLKGCVIMN